MPLPQRQDVVGGFLQDSHLWRAFHATDLGHAGAEIAEAVLEVIAAFAFQYVVLCPLALALLRVGAGATAGCAGATVLAVLGVELLTCALQLALVHPSVLLEGRLRRAGHGDGS